MAAPPIHILSYTIGEEGFLNFDSQSTSFIRSFISEKNLSKVLHNATSTWIRLNQGVKMFHKEPIFFKIYINCLSSYIESDYQF